MRLSTEFNSAVTKWSRQRVNCLSLSTIVKMLIQPLSDGAGSATLSMAQGKRSQLRLQGYHC